MDDLMTTAEVAKMLKLHQVTLRKWRSADGGPRYFLLGDGPFARVRYRRKDVEEWLGFRIARTQARDA